MVEHPLAQSEIILEVKIIIVWIWEFNFIKDFQRIENVHGGFQYIIFTEERILSIIILTMLNLKKYRSYNLFHQLIIPINSKK